MEDILIVGAYVLKTLGLLMELLGIGPRVNFLRLIDFLIKINKSPS